MKLTKEEIHDKLASIQNRQYDNQLTIHDAIEEHYRLISDIIDSIVPEKINTDDYRYEDSAQDFMLGYIQCGIEVRQNAKELLEK